MQEILQVTKHSPRISTLNLLKRPGKSPKQAVFTAFDLHAGWLLWRRNSEHATANVETHNAVTAPSATLNKLNTIGYGRSISLLQRVGDL
jgi:hypothetical protein